MEKVFAENRLILGLMRLKDLTPEDLAKVIEGCLEKGIHYFDISDIYCRHACEEKLGIALRTHPELRPQMFIQTKCGIVKEEGVFPHYDLSYDHILEAVDGSLARMNLTYVDSLLLHRPDIFLDAEEVGKAFIRLHDEGKVRHFGVSNMDVSEIEYVKSGCPLPLEILQLQLGLGQLSLLSQTFNANNPEENRNNTDGIYYYAKRNGMALQCWSPYQYGFFQGTVFHVPEMKATQDLLAKFAEKYHSTPCGIATAFLSDLGKNVEVITGSMNLAHIQESLDGTKVVLEKPDWYELYSSTGHKLP